MKYEWPVLLSPLCHPGRRPGNQRCPLFVIPGEDPGTSVEHCLLQRPVVHSGSRLKARMTKKFKLHRAESIRGGGVAWGLKRATAQPAPAPCKGPVPCNGPVSCKGPAPCKSPVPCKSPALSPLCHPGRRPGNQRCPLFVIPGEDPGTSVEHCLLQRPVVHSGSRLEARMTKKFKLHRAESIRVGGVAWGLKRATA